MIIDVNAYLGHFAFRRPAQQHRLVAPQIDGRQGMTGLSSQGQCHHLPQCTIRERGLADEVRRHRDRLVSFAVINPAYAGWRDDLKSCHEELGMSGLRLYPKWHNYSLSAKPCVDLIDETTERGLMISIPIRVEDQRERSWLVDVPDVPFGEITTLVSACPRARFILLNGLQFINSPLGKKNSGLPANYAIEVSRLDPFLANEFGQLIDNLGPERLMFGTGMPFSEPEPVLLKMEFLEANKNTREKILGQNAATWLAEKPKS